MREKAKPLAIEDNDRVRITEWHFVPGAETGLHCHTLDYVIVYLTAAKHLVEVGDDVREVLLKAGESYFRKAGIEHNVINAGEAEVVMIETELK